MFAVDGRAAQFEDGGADRVIGSKVELLLTVVTKLLSGRDTGLQAVGSDDFAAGAVFDDEVVAEKVEGILVETGTPGGGKAFAHLDVKDFEAKAAGGLALG